MDVKTPDSGSPVLGPESAGEPEIVLPEPTPADLASETPAEAVPSEAAEGVAEGEDTDAAKRYRDRWLRAEADLQNFRRRAQRDVEEARRFAEDRALLATLEHLDDLERALEAASEGRAPGAWVQGVQLVAQRMRDHLGRHGVSEVATKGHPFDPEIHEALLEVDAPAGVEPGHVVQVVRKGYERGGRALRAARVVVARPPAE